jgi:hypothetical protein
MAVDFGTQGKKWTSSDAPTGFTPSFRDDVKAALARRSGSWTVLGLGHRFSTCTPTHSTLPGRLSPTPAKRMITAGAPEGL